MSKYMKLLQIYHQMLQKLESHKQISQKNIRTRSQIINRITDPEREINKLNKPRATHKLSAQET